MRHRSLHADAEAILRAAIAAADPAPLVRRALQHAPEPTAAPRILLVAAGKAAVQMADAAHDTLGARIADAVVVAPHGTRHGTLPVLHASHPLPDGSSERAARAVEHMLERTAGDDLVLVLLSGGASALIAAPAAGLSVLQYADCVRRLMRAGADIRALNIVRQHIDRLKGGRLAARAAPARVLGLVLSDVVGDPLDIIASGPLTTPTSTAADARRVLHEYGLDADLPLLEDTPIVDNARVAVIGNNALALAGAAAHARSLGYDVHVVEQPVTGEARVAGARLAAHALRLGRAGPLCVVAGGETTVTVTGRGTGGRNQELVLAAALALHGADNIVVASAGTDGIDGPTDAAGAVADAHIDANAARAALRDNDSHGFFRRHGGLIVTGSTGTNVMDVQVVLRGG